MGGRELYRHRYSVDDFFQDLFGLLGLLQGGGVEGIHYDAVAEHRHG